VDRMVRSRGITNAPVTYSKLAKQLLPDPNVHNRHVGSPKKYATIPLPSPYLIHPRRHTNHLPSPPHIRLSSTSDEHNSSTRHIHPARPSPSRDDRRRPRRAILCCLRFGEERYFLAVGSVCCCACCDVGGYDAAHWEVGERRRESPGAGRGG
jgi:hypothetical protein